MLRMLTCRKQHSLILPIHFLASSTRSQCLVVLKLQALQCCVNILRSLVEWYTKTQTAASLAAAAAVVAAAPGIDIVGDDAASDSTAAGESRGSNCCLSELLGQIKPNLPSYTSLSQRHPAGHMVCTPDAISHCLQAEH